MCKAWKLANITGLVGMTLPGRLYKLPVFSSQTSFQDVDLRGRCLETLQTDQVGCSLRICNGGDLVHCLG